MTSPAPDRRELLAAHGIAGSCLHTYREHEKCTQHRPTPQKLNAGHHKAGEKNKKNNATASMEIRTAVKKGAQLVCQKDVIGGLPVKPSSNANRIRLDLVDLNQADRPRPLLQICAMINVMRKHPTAAVIFLWAICYLAWVYLVPDPWVDAVENYLQKRIIGVEHKPTRSDLSLKF